MTDIESNYLYLEVNLTKPEEFDQALAELESFRGAKVFWFAGKDTFCDTCGWSPSAATLVVAPKRVFLSLDTGCYGGSRTEDVDEILDTLNTIAGFMKGDFETARAALEGLRNV